MEASEVIAANGAAGKKEVSFLSICEALNVKLYFYGFNEHGTELEVKEALVAESVLVRSSRSVTLSHTQINISYCSIAMDEESERANGQRRYHPKLRS